MVMWAKCAQVAKVVYKDDFSKIYCENNNSCCLELGKYTFIKTCIIIQYFTID